jgi:hypothetical protein
VASSALPGDVIEFVPGVYSAPESGACDEPFKRRGIYVGLRMEIVPQPVELVSRVEYDPTTGEKEFLLGHKVITTSSIQSIGILI